MGLFADQFIPKGTAVWIFEPKLDQRFTKEFVEKLPPPAREYIKYHSFFDPWTKMHVLGFDNDRFWNHSDKPNTKGVDLKNNPEGAMIAARDIRKGEELTCDYWKEWKQKIPDKKGRARIQ